MFAGKDKGRYGREGIGKIEDLGGVGEIRRLVRLEWHLPGEEERDDRECRGLGHLP